MGFELPASKIILPNVRSIYGLGKGIIYLFFLNAQFWIFSSAGYAQETRDQEAERMLLFQRDNGGWPQPGGNAIDYTQELTEVQQQVLIQNKAKLDATIDDRATTREINYLVRAFQQTQNVRYRNAAEQGVRYLLTAQQANGGWAQFYPDSSGYHKQITYNDNAMIDVLGVMKHTAEGTAGFDAVDRSLVTQAQQAVARGVDCILKTQYRQQGTRTAWCAQHDRGTLLPTNARKFELASLSGAESVGILRFLMSLDNPSSEVKEAIRAGVAWLDSVRLVGTATKIINAPALPRGKDMVIVADSSSTLWARFYELDTNRPFFCGRDGVKKYNLAEIDPERRTGYAWYGTWPAKLLAKEFPNWAKKWGD